MKAGRDDFIFSLFPHLAILGHSCGVGRMAPEGPHSHTAGGPIRIREMRLATTVL